MFSTNFGGKSCARAIISPLTGRSPSWRQHEHRPNSVIGLCRQFHAHILACGAGGTQFGRWSRTQCRDPQQIAREQVRGGQEHRRRRRNTEPSAIAAIPSQRMGATTGSASRFAGTASGASRPKCHHAMGVVTSVQATEIETTAPIQRQPRGPL